MLRQIPETHKSLSRSFDRMLVPGLFPRLEESHFWDNTTVALILGVSIGPPARVSRGTRYPGSFHPSDAIKTNDLSQTRTCRGS